MKNGDDRLFIPNRTLLSGGLVTGLLLFLLLVWWQQSIPGAAIFFFIVYMLTNVWLFLDDHSSRWTFSGSLLNLAALLGFHGMSGVDSSVWMFYWLSGVLLLRHVRSARLAVALVLGLGVSYVLLEGRHADASFDLRWFGTTVLWALLLMVILFMEWVRRNRILALERQRDKLKKRLEEMREQMRRIIRKAEEWSLRDNLTGLYNLKGFQQQLRQTMRVRSPMLLLLLDVVSFSEFNAYMGREAGDELLCAIAEALKKEMPPQAILSRYAGDKFAVAFAYDETTEADIEKDLRARVERVVAAVRPVQRPLRYCVGMAFYPRDGKTWQEMINVAEKRLAQKQRILCYNLEAVRMRRERLSTIGQLAAGLAHEIRNPLTSIRGFVQLAAAQGEVMDRWKDIILSEIDRIDALLSRLLEIADHQLQRPRFVCLNDVIQKTLDLMHSETVMRGCQLKTVLPEKPVHVWLEERQFQQVLVQLIQYGMLAVEKRSDGWVEMKLMEEDDTVLLIVRDNGDYPMREGLEDVDDWTLEHWVQAKNDLYGFGFSLIEQIVSEHGGKLSIHRLPFGGKEVVISLPKGDGEREMQLVASASREHVE